MSLILSVAILKQRTQQNAAELYVKLEAKTTAELPALTRTLNQSAVLLRLDVATVLHGCGAALMLCESDSFH